jgi:hypothetical protein
VGRWVVTPPSHTPMVYHCKFCNANLKRQGSHLGSKKHKEKTKATLNAHTKQLLDVISSNSCDHRDVIAQMSWWKIQQKYPELVHQITPILDKIRDGKTELGYLMGILGKVQSSKSLSICIIIWFTQFMCKYDFSISVVVFNLLNCKTDLEWKMDNYMFSDCIERAIDEYEHQHDEKYEFEFKTALNNWFSVGSKSGKASNVEIYLGSAKRVGEMQKNVTDMMLKGKRNLVIIDEIHSIFTPANKKADKTLDTLRDWIMKEQVMVVGVSATWERVFLNEDFAEIGQKGIICEITPHIPEGFRYMDIEDIVYSNEASSGWSHDWVSRCVVSEMVRLESTEFIPMVYVMARFQEQQEQLKTLLGNIDGVFPVVVNLKTSLVSAFEEILSAVNSGGAAIKCVVVIGEGSIGISVSIRPPKPIQIGDKTLFALTALVSKKSSKQENTENIIQSRGRILGLVPLNFPCAHIYTYNNAMIEGMKSNIKTNNIVNTLYKQPRTEVNIPTENPMYPNESDDVKCVYEEDQDGEFIRKVFFGKDRHIAHVNNSSEEKIYTKTDGGNVKSKYIYDILIEYLRKENANSGYCEQLEENSIINKLFPQHDDRRRYVSIGGGEKTTMDRRDIFNNIQVKIGKEIGPEDVRGCDGFKRFKSNGKWFVKYFSS